MKDLVDNLLVQSVLFNSYWLTTERTNNSSFGVGHRKHINLRQTPVNECVFKKIVDV